MAELQNKTMKAVKWDKKAGVVRVEKVNIPKVQHPLDAIVRITSAAICMITTKLELTFSDKQ
jgi:D-arabinose 1-dehydrogenase-like Zn-dependent alcohol dehydrogenase